MPPHRVPDLEVAALAVQLRSFATKLGLDQDQVRRIVAAVSDEARETGRWPHEVQRVAEMRRRMLAAAGG